MEGRLDSAVMVIISEEKVQGGGKQEGIERQREDGGTCQESWFH